MARTTRRGTSFSEHERRDPDPGIRIRRAQLGGPSPWDGKLSQHSIEQNRTDAESISVTLPSHAHMMENPSSLPSDQALSSVDSAAGNGRATVPKQSGRPRRNARPKGRTKVEHTEFPDDDF